MSAHQFGIALQEAKILTIHTTAVDAFITIPVRTATVFATPEGVKFGTWFLVSITGDGGNGVFVNENAPATNECACLASGVYGPYFFTPGDTIHAISNTTNATVTLVPTYINYT